LSVFRSPKDEGSRAPTGAGAERRTRGPPRGRAYLRIAGDARPMTRAGRASRRSAAALGRSSRFCLSSGPRLRVPMSVGPSASTSHRDRRVPRAGGSRSRPGGGLTRPTAQAPHKLASGCPSANSGTAWLISARASRPLRQSASPVDAPFESEAHATWRTGAASAGRKIVHNMIFIIEIGSSGISSKLIDLTSCPALCRASTSFLLRDRTVRRGWPGQARP
jgi:hypothetical protein